jgi:hypothetical protein
MRDKGVFSENETTEFLAGTSKIHTAAWSETWKLPLTVFDCSQVLGCSAASIEEQKFVIESLSNDFVVNAQKFSKMVRGKVRGWKRNHEFLDRASATVRKVKGYHEENKAELAKMPKQTFSCTSESQPIRILE